MIQTIQNEIYKLLDDLIISENNSNSRYMIKSYISNILNKNISNNNINLYKVICDETNNIEIDSIYIDVYIFIHNSNCSTVISFFKNVNKISRLRKLRKDKLKKIYK